MKATSGATIIFTNLCKPEKKHKKQTHYLFHYYGLVTIDGIQVRSATFGKFSGLRWEVTNLIKSMSKTASYFPYTTLHEHVRINNLDLFFFFFFFFFSFFLYRSFLPFF